MSSKKPPTSSNKNHKRLTPAQTAEVRSQLHRKVRNQIEHAHLVVLGKKEWTPTQATIFKAFLNKVVPDLNASYVENETKISTDPSTMSMQQLQEIASGNVIIDVTPNAPDEAEIAAHPDIANDPDFQDDPFKSRSPRTETTPPPGQNLDLSPLTTEPKYDDSEL